MVPAELNHKITVLVICGPTGSGKGQLGRKISSQIPGEIVCADSRKIYRGFDIGTAKPPPAEREGIAHHLLDVCEPTEQFAAGQFAERADAAIAEVNARGRLPVVVGGTGLYIRVLLHGLVDAPARNDELRERLLAEESENPGCLYQRLQAVDPSAALQIPQNDRVRIVRALEVFETSGVPLSDLQESHRFQDMRYHALQVAPDWPRDELYRRIDSRVDRMMQAGWLDEVRRLRKQGLAESPAFQAVGYRRLSDHLDGEMSLAEAIAAVKTEHRRYARRQLGWFRADGAVRWLATPVDAAALLEEVRAFVRG